MKSQLLQPRARGVLLFLVAAGAALTGCKDTASPDAALVLFDVELVGLPSFTTLEFTAPGAEKRALTAADLKGNEFQFGYYLPPSVVSVTVTAKAIRSPSCVVGSGMAPSPAPLQRGSTTPAGKLRVTAAANAPCLAPKDAGAPADAEAGASPSPTPDAEGDAQGDGGDAEIDDGMPPTVVAFRPADRSEAADRNAPIVITFSKPIDPASLTAGAVTVSVGGSSVNGTLTADAATRTVSFKADGPLPMLAGVTVTAATKLRDLQGRALAAAASASFGTADGKWTTAEMIQVHDNLDLDDKGHTFALAADPKGNALVVWEHFASLPAADDHRTTLHVSRYTPAGGWAKSEELVVNKDGRTLGPRLAMDAMGRGLLLLSLNTKPLGPMVAGPLVARLYDPQKGWSTPPATVDGHPNGFASASHLALTPGGEAFITWGYYGPQYDRMIEGRKFSMGAFPDAPKRLDQLAMNEGALYYGSASALDRNGNVMTIWSGAVGQDFVTLQIMLMASRFTAGKGWSAPVKLTPPIKSLGAFDAEPQVVVDTGGNAIVAWTQGTGPSPDTLFYAYYNAGQAKWESPIEIAAKTSTSMALTANAGGSALLAFSDKAAVRVARISSIPLGGDGTATRPAQITRLQAGLDDRERGMVVWKEGDDITAWRYLRGMPLTPLKLSTGEAQGGPRLQVLPDGRAFAVWVEAKTPNRLMAARFE